MSDLRQGRGRTESVAIHKEAPLGSLRRDLVLPFDELATVAIAVVVAAVVIPIAIAAVVISMSAVVIPVAVLGMEIRITIALMSLCGALEAGECQQAETSRASEREKLRMHWELLSMGPRGISGPVN